MPKPVVPKIKPKLPKIKTFVEPVPKPPGPWEGQRGTMEDLESFGIAPHEFFGGGGKIMFTDTAPKPALTPKQGSLLDESYIEGFVKRASEYGFSENEAFAILKKAQISLKPITSMMAPVKALTHNMAKAAPIQKLTDTVNRVMPIQKLASNLETFELLKKSNVYSPLRNLDTSILRQNRPNMVDPQAFDREVKLDRNQRDAFRQSNPYQVNIKTPLYPESLDKLMNRSSPDGVNPASFSKPISINPR